MSGKMVNIKRLILLTIFPLFLFSPLLQAQIFNTKYDKYIDLYREVKNVPCISAGISVDTSIYWLGADGLSDLENSVSCTRNTVFRIASISKPITAVAIMQLVEQGKVDLDAYAGKYIKIMPRKKWKFTVRQILNHTSGLRTYYRDEFNSTASFPTTKDVMIYLLDDKLRYEPGTKFYYSSLAYNYLAAIIENVSGMPFNEYLRRYIFEPAGMESTHLGFQKKIIKNRASGYAKNEMREFENSDLADLSIKFPGGGILSTSEDLLRFGIALLNGRLIQQETLSAMLKPVKLMNGEVIDYGLGFALDIREDNILFGHDGNGTGFSSHLLIDMKNKLVTVDLINIRDRDLGNPARVLRKMYLNETYDTLKYSLSEEMLRIFKEESRDSAYALLKYINDDTLGRYDRSMDEFVLLGYDLIANEDIYDAIVIFRQALSIDSAFTGALKGLGDAFLADGNHGLALKMYYRVLELQPEDLYAKEMIAQIRKTLSE